MKTAAFIAVLVFYIIPILVVAGLVRPRLVLRWVKKEDQTRKNVAIYGILALAIDVFVLGSLVNTMEITTSYDVVECILFICMFWVLVWSLIGFIDPAKSIRWGVQERRNRKWVLIYTVIFFVALIPTFFIARNATIAPEELAKEEAYHAEQKQKELAEKQAEQEQKELKQKAEQEKQSKAKAEAEEAAKKDAAAEEAQQTSEESQETASPEQESTHLVREDGPVRIYDHDAFAEQENYTVVYGYDMFGNTLKAYVNRNSIDKSENDKFMSADVELVTHVKDTNQYTNLSSHYEYKKGWFFSWQYRETILRTEDGPGPWKDLGSADDGNEKEISEALKKYLEEYSLTDSITDKVKSLF